MLNEVLENIKSRRSVRTYTEQQVSAEHVNNVVLHVPPEELREHQSHYPQRHQRAEYAPEHTQHRAFVFFCKVALHQLLEQEAVLLYLLLYSFQHICLTSSLPR